MVHASVSPSTSSTTPETASAGLELHALYLDALNGLLGFNTGRAREQGQVRAELAARAARQAVAS